MAQPSLRVRQLDAERSICVSQSGSFFLASAPAAGGWIGGLLGEADQTFLSLRGHVFAPDDRLAFAARSLDILRRSSPALSSTI
jgi:hypothetical protein